MAEKSKFRCLLLQVRDERPLRVCWCGAPEGCLEAQSFEGSTDKTILELWPLNLSTKASAEKTSWQRSQHPWEHRDLASKEMLAKATSAHPPQNDGITCVVREKEIQTVVMLMFYVRFG